MAHPNIDQRREAVKHIIDTNGGIGSEDKKELSARFKCSIAAIEADTAYFIHLGDKVTRHIGSGMRKNIRQRDKDICQYCACVCTHPVVDHIRPYLQGGKAIESNLVVACPRCNSLLAGKTEEYKRMLLQERVIENNERE